MGLVTDVFNQDAFGVIEFQEEIVENLEFKPQLLGQLGIFEDMPTRSRMVGIASKDGKLTLIPTSANGEAPTELVPEGANVRAFPAVRLAEGSTIYASELAGVVGLPFDDQVKEMTSEVAERSVNIEDDFEYTWEHMRLGAILGKVYDADGTTVLYDWFKEWNINEPSEIDFELDNPETDVRAKCRDVGREMMKAGKGAYRAGTQIGCLCGDTFFDKFINHKNIKETKLAREDGAKLLENIEGYSSIEIENITFINYRGSDDGKLSIATNKARFFPIGARGVFKVAWAPADEFKPYLGKKGQPLVGMVLADPSGREAWDRVEMYSYPLFVCTRPGMLLKAKTSVAQGG